MIAILNNSSHSVLTMKKDERTRALLERILGELFALQKWAGRFDLDENKVLGVCSGIEADVNEFLVDPISEADRKAIEAIFDDIESGLISARKDDVRRRLSEAGVSESRFLRYVDVCKHSGDFHEAVEAMANTSYSYVRNASPNIEMKANFLGAKTYVELVDTTHNAKNIACQLPAIPRIGETIEAVKGELQEVVDVRHVVMKDGADQRYATACIYVYYAPIEKTGDAS